MAHKRIRKFNTKDTYPEQNLDNDLCQAVVTKGGKTIWLRGQCPQNLDDAVNLDSNDPAEQTDKVMQNIEQLIKEAGGEIKHLVKIVVYITDIKNRDISNFIITPLINFQYLKISVISENKK